MTQTEVDLRTQPIDPERSLGELVSDMTESLGTIFRKEVELAKVELKEEAGRAGRGAGMLGGGAVAAWIGLVMLSFALVAVLDEGMHVALAFFLVGLLWAVGAAVLFVRGRKTLTEAKPFPQTIASLKEDAAWARAQRN
jgi:uncharacterized membrane protein YqjE